MNGSSNRQVGLGPARSCLRKCWCSSASSARCIVVRGSPWRSAIVRVREHPFLPHRDRVRGFVYDVETGHLREIVTPG